MEIRKFFKGNAEKEIFPTWLVFFRVNIALLALFNYLTIQFDFDDFYSINGYVLPDILNASYNHYTPTIYSLQQFIHKIHLTVSYESLLLFCRIAYPLFLVMLLLGFKTRVSATGSLLLQLLMLKSIHLYEYGLDAFLTISLFYCCIFPVGRIFSFDTKISKNRAPVDHRLFLKLLRIHLCIAYFFSGFEKLLGPTWRNGEAIWKTLHSHNYDSAFNLDFLAATPFFLISGWSTILVEMLYPVFMNIERCRKYWLLAAIGLHAFIGVFMGLYFFAAIMIILNLSAFYAPFIKFDKYAFKKQTVEADNLAAN